MPFPILIPVIAGILGAAGASHAAKNKAKEMEANANSRASAARGAAERAHANLLSAVESYNSDFNELNDRLLRYADGKLSDADELLKAAGITDLDATDWPQPPQLSGFSNKVSDQELARATKTVGTGVGSLALRPISHDFVTGYKAMGNNPVAGGVVMLLGGLNALLDAENFKTKVAEFVSEAEIFESNCNAERSKLEGVCKNIIQVAKKKHDLIWKYFDEILCLARQSHDQSNPNPNSKNIGHLAYVRKAIMSDARIVGLSDRFKFS